MPAQLLTHQARVKTCPTQLGSIPTGRHWHVFYCQLSFSLTVYSRGVVIQAIYYVTVGWRV
jgi:hypothetical protein